MTARILTFNNDAWPLYTVAQLRAIEQQAEAALPTRTLMTRAGAAAAELITTLLDTLPSKQRQVWLAAGPGNNGGDALTTAYELRRQGIEVTVYTPCAPQTQSAVQALEQARDAGVPITDRLADQATLDTFGLSVDGLFGIGLSRALSGPFALAVQRLTVHAQTGHRVLALDIPSGLNSDTGCLLGAPAEQSAVQATHTLSFIGAKPGLFMVHGRDYTGQLAIAPLDLDAAQAAGKSHDLYLNASAFFADDLPKRTFASHKGSYGSAGIVGGANGMCGAAILAARAALYAGAGKVFIGFIEHPYPLFDPLHPEILTRVKNVILQAPAI